MLEGIALRRKRQSLKELYMASFYTDGDEYIKNALPEMMVEADMTAVFKILLDRHNSDLQGMKRYGLCVGR